ncbi:Nucleoside diphosphate kinase 7 [Eumeta japonica]|uniref:Nucleoside diphosphate kinase 7 n=1 Tax=Eumeta variegata TaxID=151549 RepID=A0A4C1VNA0_EUMVA|nr:Nucleoside diphosphate kinase 7 [Eumeta japonica]
MYDENADKIIQLVVNFFPFDNSVQVIDTEKKTQLLKRVQLPSLKLEALQIGNVVNIFSKLLLITGCVPITSRRIFKNVERLIIDYIINGEVIGLELVAPNAVNRWREVLGATDPKDAAPGTLRRLYGKSKLHNVAHGCNTPEDAKRIQSKTIRAPSPPALFAARNFTRSWTQAYQQCIAARCPIHVRSMTAHMALELIGMFFSCKDSNPIIPLRATFKNCTCCVIKPHAIIDGNLGAIIEQICTTGSFYISAMAMFSISVPNALEFYEVYKGVLPEYEAMATHLAEGKCLVCEIKCSKECTDLVNEFRKLCGPRDPELCRQLYPDCIRALYGKDIVHNAVHCTDLQEDGESESEYFFKLLSHVEQ